MHKLVIIVPAYNEQDSLAGVLQDIKTAIQSFSNVCPDTKLLVIDDGSMDRTREIAVECGVDDVVVHHSNRGLGAAVKSGFMAAREAGADIVVKFDADGQHDATDILALIQPILGGEADIVYGNRFPGISYPMPWIRQVGNNLFTRLMRYLTKWPIEDAQPGIFAVNDKYLEKFYLPGDYNYTQQVLLDAYHKGMQFMHVPVSFEKRDSGKSFVSLEYPLKVLLQLFWILVSVKPMKVFGRLGLAFFLVGLSIFCWEILGFILGHSNKPVVHVNVVLGSVLLGVQCLFFGTLAELVVRNNS